MRVVCSSRMYALLMGAWLAGSGLAGAQPTATLRGIVHDGQGQPIAGAMVTARAADSGLLRSGTTAADGIVVLPNLPPTTVDVVVAAPGFPRSPGPASSSRSASRRRSRSRCGRLA